MLFNTETEVAGAAEVSALKFILLDLKSSLEEFFGLLASDGTRDRYFLVSSDSEGSDSVGSLSVNGLLTSKISDDFGGLGKSISTFTSTDVEYQFGDLDVPVRVVLLLLNGIHLSNNNNTLNSLR